MALKATLADLEGLPDPIKEAYEERDGKFVLRVDGDIPGFVPSTQLADSNARLAEFRDNNNRLNSLKTELETKLRGFDGIDPAEHHSLKTRIAELEKIRVKGADDVNTIAQRAVEAAVGPMQKRLDEMTARERAAEERERQSAALLARKSTESELTSIGLKLGVDERAVPDYVRRGLEVFQYEEGRLVARQGDTPLYSPTNPTQPLGVEEWAKSLLSEAPHLFRQSKGGGAAPKGDPPPPSPRKIISNDPLEFGRNLEGIAKGDIIVQQ